MSEEVTLVDDGDGVAIIGSPDAVEQFLTSNKLASRALSTQQLLPILGALGSTAQTGALIAENSGRWVKLTEQSAKILRAGTAMKGSSVEVSRAIVTQGGKTKHILEFAKHGKALLSPAALTGAAGIMTQLAMQQTFAEITSYLETIDEKLNDVLRAQKHKVIAELVGAGIVLDDAMNARDEIGRVSEITWSKIQTSSSVIASTQAYALLEIDGILSKLDRTKADKDLREAIEEASESIGEWQAVIARCFQLDDAMGILELDRVLTESPEEIESHRRALRAQRDKRVKLVSKQTARIFDSIARASQVAYDDKFLHPANSRAIASNARAINVSTSEFVGPLGIENSASEVAERGWVEAAVEKRDELAEDGAVVVKKAADFADKQLTAAQALATRLAKEVSDKVDTRKPARPKKKPKK